jgi:hypothetical protein
MTRIAVFFPRLDRVLVRQRRQIVSDLVVWGLVTVGLAGTFLAL